MASRHVLQLPLFGEAESIGIEAALTAYTESAASISGIPDIGSLQPGRFADFILLDSDPLITPADRLTDIKVLQTYIGGRCVWSV